MSARDVRTYLLRRMHAVRIRTASIAVVALLAWVPCGAQFHPRPVTGVVTDKRGNTLPAVVQLENTRDLIVRSYITRRDGRYYFNGLNDDIDYTLRAKYRNCWSELKTLSRFNPSINPEVNLMIPVD
jgi:hypothetical protein